MKSTALRLSLVMCVAVPILATLPGCGGCRKVDPAAKKKELEELEKKKKEKPKPDFEVGLLRVQPADETVDGTTGQNLIKPGHLVTATQQMKANNFDFQAVLESAAVDRNGQPLDVEHTAFRINSVRPASLPKGELKNFETTYFVPRRLSADSKTVWLKSRLRGARGGREVADAMQPTTALPSYQYFLIVLSSVPENYGYLKRLPSVMPPWDDLDEPSQILYYRVVLPKFDRRVPLPSQPFAWTAIAYIIWDEVDPNQLTPAQQHALLDWLHWGGQIVISGPDSMDMLKGSFLAEYLPAEKVQTIELVQTAFDELNARWSLPEVKKQGVRRTLDVIQDKPPLGIELRLTSHPQSQFVPDTGSLVAERRVGRGRIAVTAFSLTSRQIVNWPNYDGFFNACILRRPRREFRAADFQSTFGAQAIWRDYPSLVRDARLVTTLRYFSRDIGYLTPRETPTAVNDPLPPEWQADRSLDTDGYFNLDPGIVELPRPFSVVDPETDPWHFGGHQAWPETGVAGWNDFSGAADAARRSLREAAGISIPKADFVTRALAVYLFVLVPVNWVFFRMIGRVEWAWAAAPIIAIAGAISVVRWAQLDIGFVRSRTEIAVLEVQADYNRAHLTRYMALYTSLSTGYELAFQDESALAQPFSKDPAFQRLPRESASTVSFRRDKEVTLEGFQVNSNSTDMVHCEQMCSLGGAFPWTGNDEQGWRIENDSELNLEDVAVLRKTLSGQREVAWVGKLAARTAVPVNFEIADGPADTFQVPQWEQSPVTSTRGAGVAGELNLSRLIELASNRLRLDRGEVRLVAWTGHELPGTQIDPRASQSKLSTLVLVHLQYGPLPEPQADVNVRADVSDDATVRDPEYNPFEVQED